MNPETDIVLTFDDSVANHATYVAPLLKELGFCATFYVCEFKGSGDDLFTANKKQYMTWEQIAGLHRDGFEVGNHTLTHAAPTKINRTTFVQEITALEERCATHSIPRPVTFAYPGGCYDVQAMEVLKEKSYPLARICGYRPYHPGTDSPLLAPSFVITGKNEALFYKALDERKPGEVIIYTFHGVPDMNHPWVDTPPPVFVKMMDELKARGLRGVAMRDLLEQIRLR